MSKIRVGTFFLLIASIMYSAKYISAAMIVSSFERPGAEHLSSTLKQFPPVLTYWIFATIAIGAGLILIGFLGREQS